MFLCAFRRMPSLLEYFSYNCNFMGILAGPTCSYNDYIAFIQGDPCRHRDHEPHRKSEGKSQGEPSPNVGHTARRRILVLLCCPTVTERTEPAPGRFGSRLPRSLGLVYIKTATRRHCCWFLCCVPFASGTGSHTQFDHAPGGNQ